MTTINGLNKIRTGQKVHIRSLSNKRRSKYLQLFMLDNEKIFLENDSKILKQRLHQNTERLTAINAEMAKVD